MQYEKSLPLLMFPILRNPETAQCSPDQWRDMVVRLVQDMLQIEGDSSPPAGISQRVIAQATAVALVTVGYPRAKRELRAAGYQPEQIEQMPVGQVIAIHQSRAYAHVYHEMFKWMYLPFDQAWPRQQHTQETLSGQGYLSGTPLSSRETIPISQLLLPGVTAAHRAETRLSAYLAALQAVEAIRMDAAQHQGRLPASLDQLALPVPHNPVTGTPLLYRVEGETAILEIPPAPGLEPKNAWRIELKMDKPKPAAQDS